MSIAKLLLDAQVVVGPDGSTSVRETFGTNSDLNALDLPIGIQIIGYIVITLCLLYIIYRIILRLRLSVFSKTISTYATVDSKFEEEYEDYNILNGGRGKFYLRRNKRMFEANKSHRIIFITSDSKKIDLAVNDQLYNRIKEF